ncbi:MAG: methylated-DNA--[protein]-cysteine S-methyltransferase [Acidobacteria bacterium]|nr:methylated-DNA--[protein]-cysteine S-methyltransferase [Acidobacteriota bacterium]
MMLVGREVETFFTTLGAPVGDLVVVVDRSGALVRIRLGAGNARRIDGPENDEPVRDPGRCAHVTDQLEAYFAGRRRRFELEVALMGTPFQLRIWQELQAIPYGTTISYGELARRAGHPRAARPAGSANARNPIPIVIPCHRVIAADGSLGGYSAGVDIKAALLRMEGAL